MTCIDTQRLITPFIQGELDIDQLEEFVNHVKSCPNCMEELEVYYVLISGMKQLDEDKELSNDFHQDLLNMIRRSDDRIFHNKFLHIRKRIVLIVVITLTAIASSFRLTEFVVEDVINKESDFLVDNLFISYEDPKVKSIILENIADIYAYLNENDPESAKKIKERYKEEILREEILKEKLLNKKVGKQKIKN
ncbi:MAG: hypothetical protein K0R92_333 [Lachnospiraceae bacterium]|jgi:hypothetical protein|nr:hypothetical protein [Lachnospiraceae bacterium]